MYTRPATYGTGFDVMGVGTQEKNSVLAGQEKIVFVDSFETIEECHETYPEARGTHNNSFTEPRNTYDHLSDGGDGW